VEPVERRNANGWQSSTKSARLSGGNASDYVDGRKIAGEKRWRNAGDAPGTTAMTDVECHLHPRLLSEVALATAENVVVVVVPSAATVTGNEARHLLVDVG
jgi:hypothetical protein